MKPSHNQESKTCPHDSLSSAVPVPSDKVVNAMENAFDKTEDTGKEYGFRVGVNGTVTSMVEGTEIDISNWNIPMEELRAKGEYAAYDVHTHPKGNSNSYGLAEPSPTDTENVIKSSGQPSVVLGYKPTYPNSPQLERGIGFYNSSGLISKPMSFSKFQRAVTRINKL